jgi:two-component system cell cycle sensor histidine kinase/response regulator CckA
MSLDDRGNLPLSNKEGRLTTQDPSEPRPDRRSSGQRQADQTLEEETRLQTALLDNIPGCIALILRKDTREIVASNRFAREIGAVPGQTCFQTCAQRDDHCPFCLAPKLWATGQSQRIEVEYRGTWYEGTWVPLSEDLYVHYIFDISVRKQTEELLCRTQFVVDHSQDPVQWVDPEGRVLYVNDAACRRLGYSREELLSMSVSDIDVLAPQPWSSHFQEVGEGGSVAFESLHRAKDGEIFPVEVTVNYLNYGGREYSCATARDITERKRVEDALKASEERYRQLIESAHDWIWEIDEHGVFVFASPKVVELLGYEPAEVLGKTPFDLMPPNEAERVAAVFSSIAAKREPFRDLANTNVHKDGSLVFLETSGMPVFDSSGSYRGYRGLDRDITERRRAEQSLQLAQFSIDNSADFTLWLGQDGRFLNASESLCNRLGYSRDELMAMSLFDIDLAAVPEAWPERWRELKQHGPLTFEREYRTKGGEIFPVEVHGVIFLHDGQEYDCAIARDITERKQTEKSLRMAQFSVDHVADCIFWADHDGRYTDVSQTTCALLGYSREELLTMSVFDLTLDLSPDDWPDRWRELKEHGPLTFEKRYRAKNGEILPVEINSCVLEYEGREHLLGILRDITKRKLVEEALRLSDEQLRQSQKMEAVGQLAGGIAHDFNNLLTAILGYSEMILANKAASLDEVRLDVAEIKQAGERASALTQQILAFSRRQILRPAALSLNEVLQGMESLLRRTLGEDIDLVTLEHPHLDLTEVDRHQFEQVLMNLALNARDAMPSGGRLTLETGNVELDEEYCRAHPEMAPGSYVMLSVSDTGVGMDPDTMDHIFEPFFTTKAFGEGSGLGLAVIHGIVRQSNGSILVRSEPGKGATFKIYLPRAGQADIPEEVVIPTHVSVRGHETIMVVEDEAALRSLIERVLDGAGYTTLARGSAAEALEALEHGDCSIDLLLTDVVLPGALQGNDLARAVLAVRPDLPVLYVSGYTRDALVHAGRLDEGVNLLEKPFTPEALAATVRTVLDHPRPLE